MILYVALAAVLMVLSVPLYLVFGIGAAGIALDVLHLPPHTLMQVSFDAMTKHVLVAIPIFIFAGAIMYHGGAAARLVAFGMAAVGHLPGGMALALVLSIAIFGAISGSILASIVAIGSVMMPSMIRAGYPKPFVIVLTASAALIDALIPPSNTAIIFSSITHVPVSKTFSAGILPGILLMTLLLVYSMWRCRDLPRPPKAPMPERIRAFGAALPSLLLPALVLGGLYGGLLTPSESASIASVYAILLGLFVYRELTWDGIFKSLRSTAETSTAIFAIIALAVYLSIILTYTRTPQTLIEFFSAYGIDPLTFFLIAGIVFLILGTFLEAVPVFYLTLPIFYPLCQALKIDLLQFYVFMVGLVGIGLLTPPVCVGVYTSAAVIREPPNRAFKAVPGFIVVALVYTVIVVLVPSLATWLPRFM
ncbi:MAG: TRAP transporter large permease [Lautropia sp.]